MVVMGKNGKNLGMKPTAPTLLTGLKSATVPSVDPYISTTLGI